MLDVGRRQSTDIVYDSTDIIYDYIIRYTWLLLYVSHSYIKRIFVKLFVESQFLISVFSNIMSITATRTRGKRQPHPPSNRQAFKLSKSIESFKSLKTMKFVVKVFIIRYLLTISRYWLIPRHSVLFWWYKSSSGRGSDGWRWRHFAHASRHLRNGNVLSLLLLNIVSLDHNPFLHLATLTQKVHKLVWSSSHFWLRELLSRFSNSSLDPKWSAK